MRFKKKSVNINGRTFFYWDKPGSEKKTILLLHGFPGNHGGLLDLAKGLSQYRLIIPDLPGCGVSESLLEINNLENYSNWLSGFLQQLSVDEVIIIGHSFGARLGLVFSERYPQKVSQLVLITPVVEVEGLIARLASIEYKIAELLPQPLKKLWLTYDLHRQIGNRIIFKSSSQRRRKQIMRHDLVEFNRLNPKINIELFSEFYRFSLIPIGKKVATKTLVIAGDIDEIAPLASIEKLTSQLAHVHLQVMKNSGHLLPLERPMATASIIHNWLNVN